jgi:hypothetical protein
MARKKWTRGGGGRGFRVDGIDGCLDARDRRVAAREGQKYLLALQMGSMTEAEVLARVRAAVEADRRWRKLSGE